ncbi:phage tail protein [Streptomyces tsukubensis]|uniref:phage tail protein n=1 Tax=Streptomyces tsukubensis TaxID=83656 RepID=UPI0036A767A3
MSLVRALNKSNTALKDFKTKSDDANRAAGNLKNGAQNSEGGVKKLRDAARQAASQLKTLKDRADSAEKSVTKAGKSGQTGGTNIGKFKGGADNAKKGMDGLNTSMKGNIFTRLLELFMPLIEKVVQMATESEGMRKILKKAFDAVKKAIEDVWKKVGPIIKNFGKSIKDTFDKAREKVSDIVGKIRKSVKDGFDNVKKRIEDPLKAARDKVKEIWDKIKGHIKPVTDFIEKVPKVFKHVKDELKNKWEGLKDTASKTFGRIKDAVKGPINDVIDIVNSAIGKVNSFDFKVPEWVPGIGGKGIPDIPGIPRLAEGGVVAPRAGGVPAIIAEAGEAEAVLPLSKLNRLLRHTALNARAQGGTGPGFHIEHYHAAPTTDPRSTAKALMFLAKARG